MTRPEIRNDDRLGVRVVAFVLVMLLAGAVAFLATNPEPCTDRTTTVCGGPRSAP